MSEQKNNNWNPENLMGMYERQRAAKKTDPAEQAAPPRPLESVMIDELKQTVRDMWQLASLQLNAIIYVEDAQTGRTIECDDTDAKMAKGTKEALLKMAQKVGAIQLDSSRAPAAIEQARPQPPELRDPTPQELDSPRFNAVWKAIKGWDIRRTPSAGYAGATGTDVCTILDALAAAEPAPERTREDELLKALHQFDVLMAELDEALASPEEIERDTKAVGGFVSGLDLTYTAETVLKKAIARLRAVAVPEPAAQQEFVTYHERGSCATLEIDGIVIQSGITAGSMDDMKKLAYALNRKLNKLRARQAEPAPTPSREASALVKE